MMSADVTADGRKKMTKKRLEFLKRVGRCELISLREINRYWRNVTGLVEPYHLTPEAALANCLIDETSCKRMQQNNEVVVPVYEGGMFRLQLTAAGLEAVCAHDSEWAQIFRSGRH